VANSRHSAISKATLNQLIQAMRRPVANSSEDFGSLDKLGVTGSSPVLPTKQKPRSRRLLLSGAV
jgi:hypothetical protein